MHINQPFKIIPFPYGEYTNIFDVNVRAQDDLDRSAGLAVQTLILAYFAHNYYIQLAILAI